MNAKPYLEKIRPYLSTALYTLVAFAVLLGVALLISACSTSVSPTINSPESSDISNVEKTPEENSDQTFSNPFIKQFGETVTYGDGVNISVSEPVEFTPSRSAMGADQEFQMAFKILIVNGSDEPLEPSPFPSVSSGGVESFSIYDSESSVGDIGYGPTTTILPGQSIEWVVGYTMSDPTSITFEVSPTLFSYDSAIFTNVTP